MAQKQPRRSRKTPKLAEAVKRRSKSKAVAVNQAYLENYRSPGTKEPFDRAEAVAAMRSETTAAETIRPKKAAAAPKENAAPSMLLKHGRKRENVNVAAVRMVEAPETPPNRRKQRRSKIDTKRSATEAAAAP